MGFKRHETSYEKYHYIDLDHAKTMYEILLLELEFQDIMMGKCSIS
ncbi:MAG: hypothetical protein QW743_00130 [Candidatus Methanomethylicia archaeon]